MIYASGEKEAREYWEKGSAAQKKEIDELSKLAIAFHELLMDAEEKTRKWFHSDEEVAKVSYRRHHLLAICPAWLLSSEGRHVVKLLGNKVYERNYVRI